MKEDRLLKRKRNLQEYLRSAILLKARRKKYGVLWGGMMLMCCVSGSWRTRRGCVDFIFSKARPRDEAVTIGFHSN